MKKLMSPAAQQPTFAPADILLPTLVASLPFLPNVLQDYLRLSPDANH